VKILKNIRAIFQFQRLETFRDSKIPSTEPGNSTAKSTGEKTDFQNNEVTHSCTRKIPPSKTRRKKYSDERIEKTMAWVNNHLSKLVIGTMACSIGALVLFLAVMEWRVGEDIRQIYLQMTPEPGATQQHNDMEPITEFLSLLTVSRESTDEGTINETKHNEHNVLHEARQNKLMLYDDEAALFNYIYSKELELELEKLTSCEHNIKQLQLSGIQRNQPDAATASATAMLEHRKNLQQFWLQAAQLILLNLLLPLLTALFGYIFGRQQTERFPSKRHN
jgi:hypothetical protein